MYIPNSQPAATELLPTMYDLPSEDPEEPGLPDEFHDFQPELLRLTCCPPNYPNDRVFTASDLNLYYDSNHLNWYKRPDWFVVLGVPKFYQERELRLSYVMWQELISPLVVVELISPGTEDEDLGITRSQPHKPPTKWQVYERILKVPYYVVFDRYNEDRLRVYQLVGDRYREQILTQSRFWIPELELGLGLWSGSYNGCDRQWLRWYDAQGNWIATPAERAEAERIAKESAQQQAEQERIAKESAQQQVEQERIAKESALQEAEEERIAKESAQQQLALLAQQLRAMGINLDEL
ncbi:MAG: Uma2 family endonuclease [Microcoleus sp. SU_5_3]|nr:Uma2 family endonuclease [Microcoleus sp. SU_5_3]